MANLISIKDAVALGTTRIRGEKWINPLDHIKLDIIEGLVGWDNVLGPWIHLYSPINTFTMGGEDPLHLLSTMIDMEEHQWLPYEGPSPESDEYKSKCWNPK